MRKVLITGATSGIGEGLALAYLKRGYFVILTGRNEKKLATFAQEYPSSTLVCPLDLSQETEPLCQLIQEYLPDICINNAGFGNYRLFVNLESQVQQEMLRVNVEALTTLSRVYTSSLAKQGKEGILLNVASSAPFYPFPGAALYAATKAFVVNLSRSLDAELRPVGIRVLVSCPGFVHTHFSQRASGGKDCSQKMWGMSVDHVVRSIVRQIDTKKKRKIVDFRYTLLYYLRHLCPERIQAYLVRRWLLS